MRCITYKMPNIIIDIVTIHLNKQCIKEIVFNIIKCIFFPVKANFVIFPFLNLNENPNGTKWTMHFMHVS